MNVTQEQIDAVEKIARVDTEIVRGVMARVPPSWTLFQHLPAGGAFRRGGLQVLFTVQKYFDNRIWLHCSVTGRRGESTFYFPSWEDFKRVKHDFIGPDRWAYQVLPSEKQYVNQHPTVLHLYALLDGEPALPDFTWGLGTI
jgi:hypothetical protein